MLYINRCVGRDKWGVVDTDDYVETVVDRKQLHEAVLINGLDIKGVEVSSGRIAGKYGGAVKGTYIKSVEVYQNPEFQTRSQAKAALLYGVDIKVAGRQIVSVSVPDGLRKKYVKIRLSDFGDSCSTRILENIYIGSSDMLFLVLDDKIQIVQKTFEGIALESRVVLDVREVTNSKTLDRVYTCEGFKTGPSGIDVYIQDDLDRLDFYKGVGILAKGIGAHSANFKLSELQRSPELVGAELEERYAKSFKDLADCAFEPRTQVSADLWIDTFLHRADTNNFQETYRSGKLTYEYAKEHSTGIFWILRSATKCNQNSLNRFSNYVTWFTPSKELREAYVRLCVRTIKWCTEYGISKGLV